jgi:hypothetical protein
MRNRQLTARDIAGAIAELSEQQRLHAGAIAQLAGLVGYSSPAAAELSDTAALEVDRICLTHSGMLNRPGSAFPDLGDGSYEEEVVRLTAMSRQSRPHRRGAGRASRAEGQTLALTAGGAVSEYGLPITYAGRQISADEARRLGLGRTLAPMVVDVTNDESEDISSWVGRSTGGLGDGPDQSPDMGAAEPGFGDQTEEWSNPYAVSQPSAEVSRLVQAGAAAGISGLRTGAKKAKTPDGKFTSRHARLSGTLSGV